MNLLTKQEIEKLLYGTTPGPWEKMLGTHGRNKICATYPCINGLSALFTIADVNVPEESERGYTDDAFNPDVAAANTGLIVSAPDLARTALDALARLEDAEAAQALVVERAAEVGADATIAYWREADKPVAERKHGGASMPSFVMKEILALADPSGVAALAALRAERDELSASRERRGRIGLSLARQRNEQRSRAKKAEAERDDALTRLAAAEAQVGALRNALELSRGGWRNALELDLLPEMHRHSAKTLADIAEAALASAAGGAK